MCAQIPTLRLRLKSLTFTKTPVHVASFWADAFWRPWQPKCMLFRLSPCPGRSHARASRGRNHIAVERRRLGGGRSSRRRAPAPRRLKPTSAPSARSPSRRLATWREWCGRCAHSQRRVLRAGRSAGTTREDRNAPSSVAATSDHLGRWRCRRASALARVCLGSKPWSSCGAPAGCADGWRPRRTGGGRDGIFARGCNAGYSIGVIRLTKEAARSLPCCADRLHALRGSVRR